MAGEVRAKMVDGAVRLLATRGLDGTSFSEVLELTGAPRGSVYHHFPDGKEQLIGSAVDLAGQRAITLLDQWTGESPEVVTRNFLNIWREILTRSGLSAGCAVVAVTVSTDSPELLEHTAAAFRAWREKLTELFSTGMAQEAARRFAATLVATSEGAVVICRAEQSMEAFDLVSEQLLDQASALSL